jgi:hypothetical protein
MLTKEEEAHRNEIILFTEEVLHAQGLKCDASIAKVSEEQLKEILERVRELRKKKKTSSTTEVVTEDEQKEVTCVQ